MMIDHVTGWFKITQYNDYLEISSTNSAENTWMSR